MKLTNSYQCLNRFLKEKYFHGAVLCVYHQKRLVFHESLGFNHFETQQIMQNNQIFRAYSLTKLVTLAATFLCLQQNLFTLDDELGKFFPEFQQVQVLVNEQATATEPLKTPLTIHHLLTMTSGLTYFGNKNFTQIQTTQLLNLLNDPTSQMTLADFVRDLSQIPLLFQPGTKWKYGLNFDVLGALIEKVTGQSFRDFCHKNIFQPLKMVDTDFYLIDRQREALVYRWSYQSDEPQLTLDPQFHFLMPGIDTVPPACLGGSGLFTTAQDFAAFLNLFVDGRGFDGQEIFNSQSLKMLHAEHLQDLKPSFRWTLNADYSYGYGMRVRVKNENYPLTNIGECGWDGYLGSAAIIDPEKEIVACLMLSSAPGHNRLVESDFFAAFYNDLAEEL